MTTTSMDRQKFLGHLKQSGLLSAEQLVEAVDRLPDTHRGRLVARHFVERGLLTKFQAEMLLAGRTSGFVLGQYRILEQLGQGGTGRVFKAVHQAMNRVVALKLIFADVLKTERGLQMFQREVQAAARLMHPNIVTAYDANRFGDRHYLIMEYVDGPNLEQLVRDAGPLAVGQACDFIRQAAQGLDYAHQRGMVHRDIKPSNLLVQRPAAMATSAPCLVKILDFGLARLHEPSAAGGPGTILIQGNVVMGTPDFLSPEQARNLHHADIRSDLYSLGCTFYFLLTGQVPFPGGNNIEKLMRHWTDEALPVERHRADVPPAVGAIVRLLLAKDPDARFQTPAELAAALAPLTVAGALPWPAPGQSPSESEAAFETDEPPESQLTPEAPATAEEESILGTWPEIELAPATPEVLPSVQLHAFVQKEQRRQLKTALIAAVVAGAAILIFAGWWLIAA
jgi:serine/threonine-protein kinase